MIFLQITLCCFHSSLYYQSRSGLIYNRSSLSVDFYLRSLIPVERTSLCIDNLTGQITVDTLCGMNSHFIYCRITLVESRCLSLNKIILFTGNQRIL